MRYGYRVVDVDSHVTPSMEVLKKFAGTEIKSRWDEFSPYFRTMNSPLGRGHPESPWTTIKINPIPYDRIAGQPEVAEKVKKAGGSGPLEGRVQNIAKDLPTTGTQHENSEGRISDMDVEGVDVNGLIPGTWASASSSLDSSLTTGLYGAYHNYMKEFCGNHPKRLKGLMLAACGDVDWTVNELKSRGEEEWMSCVWPILPEGLPVDDPSLEPIWEVMNDLELPNDCQKPGSIFTALANQESMTLDGRGPKPGVHQTRLLRKPGVHQTGGPYTFSEKTGGPWAPGTPVYQGSI